MSNMWREHFIWAIETRKEENVSSALYISSEISRAHIIDWKKLSMDTKNMTFIPLYVAFKIMKR